jgi:hypothetical protein
LKQKSRAIKLRGSLQIRLISVGYFFSLLRRAAQRAFIMSLSFFRAAGDIRPRRRPVLAGLAVVTEPVLRPPLARAQRARAAAAIFARVAADMVRRPVVFLLELEVEVDRLPPTRAARRCSSASIWRRTPTASSNRLSDKSILKFLAVR